MKARVSAQQQELGQLLFERNQTPSSVDRVVSIFDRNTSKPASFYGKPCEDDPVRPIVLLRFLLHIRENGWQRHPFYYGPVASSYLLADHEGKVYTFLFLRDRCTDKRSVLFIEAGSTTNHAAYATERTYVQLYPHARSALSLASDGYYP